MNRIERVCAVHGTRLFERTDPDRDTSGLYCSLPLPGEKGGHNCLVWNVMVGKKVVASGSVHPNQDDEYIWYDEAYLAGAKRHIIDLIAQDEAPQREMRVRSVARVSESTVEDWQ